MERKQKTEEKDLERNKLKERRKQKADGREECLRKAGKRKGSSEQTGERDRASEWVHLPQLAGIYFIRQRNLSLVVTLDQAKSPRGFSLPPSLLSLSLSSSSALPNTYIITCHVRVFHERGRFVYRRDGRLGCCSLPTMRMALAVSCLALILPVTWDEIARERGCKEIKKKSNKFYISGVEIKFSR